MSMHKIPLTELEREGLNANRLPIGTPSQLSDCFRHGVKWALDNAVPKWISIGDRLPVYGDDCLIVADGEVVNLIFEFKENKFSGDDYFQADDVDGTLFNTRHVTHWMPLPAAPDGDK